MSEAVPTGRFEWERLVRRILLPKPVKLAALILATYADPDGSRVRPGMDTLAAVTGDSERNARRMVDRLVSLQLVTLVRRGGGRGGKGSASEYRLTIPSDYLDRFDTLGPDDRPDTQMSGHSEVEAVDNPGDNTESPDTQMSAQSDVDSANDRTSNTVTKRMTGHFQRMTGHPDVRLPPTSPTTHRPRPVVTTQGESRPRARPPARQPPTHRTERTAA